MTAYILLEKDLATDFTVVFGVYDNFKLAQEVMEEEMTAWEELRSYKIVQRELNDR